MIKLYYVVEKQLDQVTDEIEETTGWKLISVYKPEIEPKNMDMNIYCEFEVLNTKNSEEEILKWIEKNVPEEEQVKLIQL